MKCSVETIIPPIRILHTKTVVRQIVRKGDSLVFSSNIGLDIGSSSIRAVQCGAGKSKTKVLKVGQVQIPSGTIQSGQIKNEEALTDALQLLWKQYKFSGKIVTLGISGQPTVIRQVDLPWEPSDIFREALPLRLGNQMPVDPFLFELDHYPLSEFAEKGVLQQRSLVVAANRVSVETFESVINKSKLRLRAVDYVPYAMIRAAVFLGEEPVNVPGEPEPGEHHSGQVVVNIGGETTELAIHDRGRPLFIRSINAGADSVTRALADRLSIPVENAEILKRYMGLSAVGTPPPLPEEIIAAMPPNAAQTARQIINAMAGALVQNVRDSVDYYMSSSAATVESINGVKLMGGGSLLPGFRERLQSDLRSETVLLNPLTKMSSKVRDNIDSSTGVEYACAYGLAVRV